MPNESFSHKVHEFIDSISKEFSPELLEFFQEKFEANITEWIEIGAKELEVKLVVDSNSVIRSLKYYAKKKSDPLLFKLLDNPIFPIFAPINLEDEVLDYIANKEENKKLKPILDEGWTRIKQQIKFHAKMNLESWNEAIKIIGKNDGDDIPFVGVYLDLKASAIITDDKHFDHPEIRKLNIEALGEIVGSYHRGVFSFFIIDEISPLVVELIRYVCGAIFKILVGVIMFVMKLIKAIVEGSVETISKLIEKINPKFVLLLLIATSLILIFHEGARKKVLGAIHSIKEKVQPMISKILELLKKIANEILEYVKKVSPYAGMTFEALKELTDNIEKLREEINKFSAEESLSSS